MHADYDSSLVPVICRGPRLDIHDWADTYERFAMLHKGEVVAVSNRSEPPYRERMLRFYADVAKLECLPLTEEVTFMDILLDFHIGNRVSFQYEDRPYTARIQDVFLGADGKPEYVLDQFDPPILLEAGTTLAAVADELLLVTP